MKASQSTFPGIFGDAVRSISDWSHGFKANEWKNWALLFSPILLADRLDQECYEQWLQFIKALEIVEDSYVTLDSVDEAEERFAKFLLHYEKTYYRYKFSRLQCCKSQFHLVAHVAEGIRWLGPMTNYSQWTMERVCGILVDKVKSRSQANRNLSLAIQTAQQLHSIPLFLATDDNQDLDDSDTSTGSDSDINQPPCYSSIIQQLHSIKGRAQKKASGRSLRSYTSKAVLTIQKPKRKLKAWEVMLTKAYLQQNLIEEQVPKDQVQIWKTCKLNLAGHVLDQKTAVRSANFEYQASRDASHCRYEAIPVHQTRTQDNVEPSTRTFYGRIQFYFSFGRQLLAIVRPFKVEVFSGNGLSYRITGKEPLRVIHIDQIRALVGIVEDPARNTSFIIERDSAMLV